MAGRPYHRGMDLKDATLMLLGESDGHPAVASLAKSAYDRLARGEDGRLPAA